MSETVLARRYLNAFVACFEGDDKVTALKDLSNIIQLIQSNDETVRCLSNPVVSDAKKISVVKGMVPETKRLVKNFLCVLVQKKRTTLLSSIYAEIDAIKSDLENTLKASVYSSSKLQDSQLATIKSYLSDYFKKDIQLEELIDDSIMAGIRVDTSHVIFDLTLNNSLEKLKLSFN